MGGSRAMSVGVWAAAVAATALALGAATAAVAFYQAALTTDFCRRLCAPQPRQYINAQCEQGCKFFKIDMNIKRTADRLSYLNYTKEECHQSCSDLYTGNEKLYCNTGCSKMLQFQKAIWLYLEQRVETEGVLEIEVSLVSDPALWKSTLEYHGVYKMPQTVIRTMPLQPEIESNDSIEEKTWSPCSPQKSDIPLWIVAVIAIALTIFTLYVSFILPSRTEEETVYRNLIQEEGLYESDDLRKELDVLYNGDHKKDEGGNLLVDLNLMSLNEFLTEDYHTNVVPPPKYTLLPVDENREVSN